MPTASTPHRELGLAIRKAREEAGYSQERLAPLVGITRRHMIRLEAGQHRPLPELLGRIAETVGVPVESFEEEE